MLRGRAFAAAAVLLGAGAFAGCADEPAAPTAVRATGTNGIFMSPLVYDGSGIPFQGSVSLDVDGVANAGSVSLRATLDDNESYEVTWTSFAAAPDRPFQDGGVAMAFREHGASGVGDTSIPEVNLIAAGWGPASVKRGTAAYADPVTGLPTWAAHFMLTDTGVFGADGRVKTASGGVFDPARAADGAVEPGDLEIHVVLRNNPGPPASATPIEVGGAIQGPVQATETADIPEASAMNVTLFVRPSTAAPPISQVRVVLKDPTGAEVDSVTSTPGQPIEKVVPVLRNVEGTWTVEATGQGAAGSWGASFAPVPPASKVLYFVFDEVTIG